MLDAQWDGADPSDEASRNERLKRLKDAIEQLSPIDRDTISLHLIGMTEEQIAEKLGIPKGTVKSRLNRAKTQLRDLLGRAGPEPAF